MEKNTFPDPLILVLLTIKVEQFWDQIDVLLILFDLVWSKFEVIDRSSRPEVFLVKSVLKICSKFTLEHPYQNVKMNLKTIPCLQISTQIFHHHWVWSINEPEHIYKSFCTHNIILFHLLVSLIFNVIKKRFAKNETGFEPMGNRWVV